MRVVQKLARRKEHSFVIYSVAQQLCGEALLKMVWLLKM